MVSLDKRRSLFLTVCLLCVCLFVWQISTVPHPEYNNISNPTSPNLNFQLLSTNSTNPPSTSAPFAIDTLPIWDYTTLIQFDYFVFEIINVPCHNATPIVLIITHSAPENKERRRVIRETWAKPRNMMYHLFLLAKSQNQTLQKDIEIENEKFHDIVQGNFLDSYKNLTYKHVMGLKYVIYHCPNVKYVIKTDDDTFVNTMAMVDIFNNDVFQSGARKMIICSPVYNSKVKRTFRSKWRVSPKDYKNRWYPTYCPGWLIIYSPDVVFDLYKEAQKSEYFWIDDVHLTGTLADRLNISHTSLDVLNVFSNGVQLFGNPEVIDTSLRELWEKVVKHEMGKKIS